MKRDRYPMFLNESTFASIGSDLRSRQYTLTTDLSFSLHPKCFKHCFHTFEWGDMLILLQKLRLTSNKFTRNVFNTCEKDELPTLTGNLRWPPENPSLRTLFLHYCNY